MCQWMFLIVKPEVERISHCPSKVQSAGLTITDGSNSGNGAVARLEVSGEEAVEGFEAGASLGVVIDVLVWRFGECLQGFGADGFWGIKKLSHGICIAHDPRRDEG